ncbi:MAG: enoyl-CoA hydratase/isomerase family protein [Desulfovibrio sp.]|nr:MAG: enoyl-CoA hydratase/isomerase family protein [Desulfovibrio sp.]
MSEAAVASGGEVRIEGPVALWEAKGDFFSDALSLGRKERIFDQLNTIDNNPEVSVLLIAVSGANAGHDKYVDFFSRQLAGRDVNRFVNMLAQLAARIMSMNTFVVQLSHGDLFTAMLGLSMFCDYRLATEEARFHNVFQDVKATPLGGLPFFLVERVGKGRAYELLLLGDAINARQARDCGLVDRIIPSEDRIGQALEVVRRFGELDQNTLLKMKSLVNSSHECALQYCEKESRVFVSNFLMS